MHSRGVSGSTGRTGNAGQGPTLFQPQGVGEAPPALQEAQEWLCPARLRAGGSTLPRGALGLGEPRSCPGCRCPQAGTNPGILQGFFSSARLKSELNGSCWLELSPLNTEMEQSGAGWETPGFGNGNSAKAAPGWVFQKLHILGVRTKQNKKNPSQGPPSG